MHVDYFATKDHHENILGFDLSNRLTWCLPNGSVWSFGSNIRPNPTRKRETAVCVIHAAPALPNSKITNILQYLISAAARNGISEVIAYLKKQQIISRTHSPYSSLPWPVRKPDRRWGLTTDYRLLNATTTPVNSCCTKQCKLHSYFASSCTSMDGGARCKRYVLYGSLEGGGLKKKKKDKAFTWEETQYTFHRLP